MQRACFWKFSLFLIIVVYLFPVNLYPQKSDTVFATVTFNTKDASNNNPLANVKLVLKPHAVQLFSPDTTFIQFSDSNGEATFSDVPVYLDTINPGIVEMEASARFMVWNRTLCFYSEESADGLITVYSLNGTAVIQQAVSGNEQCVPLHKLPAGVFLFAFIPDQGTALRGKFLYGGGMSGGKHYVSAKTTAYKKTKSSYTADYRIVLNKAGYDKDSSIVTLNDGSNGIIPISLSPTPPPQDNDIQVTVRDLDRNPLHNVLMVLKDQQSGSIDSLRSDSAGVITFQDLPLGKSYFVALGGKAGYTSWDGSGFAVPNTFIISTPNTINTPDDTLQTRNYCLVPSTLYSHLNDTNICISAYDMRGMFIRFNIQISLYDTAYAYFDVDDWTPTQIATREYHQQMLSDNLAIPIKSLPTPFDLSAIVNYDPFATNPLLVGTNFVAGGNITWNMFYGFISPSSPFYGDVVIMAADSIEISGSPTGFVKEHLRWFGAIDVTSRPSAMNPYGNPLNDIDAALINMYYRLGRNRYQFQVHDLPDMSYLRDTVMLISAPVLP